MPKYRKNKLNYILKVAKQKAHVTLGSNAPLSIEGRINASTADVTISHWL